jgi:stage V sporulation protein D (sporulation-specific penicillin-binding protein)
MKRRRSNVRLYVVGVAAVVLTCALWARLIHVQHFRHAHYAGAADRQSVQPRDIPPMRGGIFDRSGRPLALNVKLCAVGVTPSALVDRGAAAKAIARELRIGKRQVLRKIRAADGFVYMSRQCELSDEQRDRLRRIRGVTVDSEPGRVYPYGAVAAKLVGSVGYDNDGRNGVEIACDGELSGAPGRERVIRNGRYASERYHRIVQKRPRNGKHVYLTIDAGVQELAEREIADAVEEHDAGWGTIIVMEISTGEVLALAEYPGPVTRNPASHVDSLWTIRSLSHVYEPGSTFKIVTAAALLESKRARPTDEFDAENGRADLGFAVINDPHPHELITFAEAFAYSSNVVMAKAARLVSPEVFYKYVRLFGFGEKTGVRMTGESAGTVPEVDSWSARTQSTMAFGQEVAVTPLQMLCAYAAIANDGIMMMPRIVKGIADEESGEVKKFKPVRVRRVVSAGTARTLRGFCDEVVDYGTGVRAAVDFVSVAGKTGTGQKASPRGGYRSGKYVASFIGYAPREEPRIACLVLLDEPRWASRYGGDSTAPVFARLCRGLANSTGLFDGSLASEQVATTERERDRYSAPNFLRMERAAALERARRLGANVLCQGELGRVVSQSPAPGSPMDRDGIVRLLVADGQGRGVSRRGRAMPDLRGLTMREAKLRAAQHGFRASFVGSGVVERQSPRPGKETSFEVVKLYCARGRVGGSR